MAVRKKTDIPSDIPLPIVLDDYNSCSITLSAEGITFIKDRWQPTAGDNSLHCEEEKTTGTTSVQLR